MLCGPKRKKANKNLVFRGESCSSPSYVLWSPNSISIRETTRWNYLDLIETILSLIVPISNVIGKVSVTWGTEKHENDN